MPLVKDMPQQENETFPQTNFTPKAASPLKTILLIVVGLVFVSAIAFAGFWYGQKSQTPIVPEKEATTSTEKAKEELPPVTDETAGWKTYVNQNFKFSFRYPEELVYGTDKSGIVSLEGEGEALSMVIHSYGNPSKLSVIDWLAQDEGEAQAKGYLAPFRENTKFVINACVGGLPAYKDTREIDYQKSLAVAGGQREFSANPQIYYFVARGDKVYRIKLSDYDGARVEEAYLLFDKIVSTFKFL